MVMLSVMALTHNRVAVVLCAAFAELLLAVSSAQSQGYSDPYYYEPGTSNGTIFISGYYGTAGYPIVPTNLIIPTNLIGYTVTGIANDAFEYLSSLTNVTIPATVADIGTDAFYDCTALLSINVDPESSAYSSADGVLFDKGQTMLIQFPGGKGGSYVIPETVLSMASDAFGECTNLLSVAIPYTITSLSSGLFAGDSSLTNVLIPSGVANIADYVFQGCSSLPDIMIPSGAVYIGIEAFSQDFKLTSITIPNGVTSINNLAFQYSGLASVTIPNSVTNIGIEVFCYSPNLTRVTIGSGLASLGIEAFSYCPSLVSFSVDSNNPSFMSAGGVLFGKSPRHTPPISSRQSGHILRHSGQHRQHRRVHVPGLRQSGKCHHRQ